MTTTAERARELAGWLRDMEQLNAKAGASADALELLAEALQREPQIMEYIAECVAERKAIHDTTAGPDGRETTEQPSSRGLTVAGSGDPVGPGGGM